MLTTSENNKKGAKNRDYSFVEKNHQNRKCVKAINIETNEVTYFNSIYATEKYLGVNNGTIIKVCENKYFCKTGISKKDGKRYRFEYVKKEDMPENYIKSENIRPKRVSEEEKARRKAERLNKLFVCKCGNSYKHRYRSVHMRYCKSESRINRIMEKIKINEYKLKRSLNKIEEKYEKNRELKRFKVGDIIVHINHYQVACEPKFYKIGEESRDDFMMYELEPEYDYCGIDHDIGYAYLDTLHLGSLEPIKINKSVLNKDENYDLHHENETYQFYINLKDFQEFY